MLHVYPSVVDGEGFWDAAVCLLLGPCSRAVRKYFAYPRDRPQVKQVQKRIKKLQADKKKVTVNGLKSHYNLTCSPKTIKSLILEAMGQKWLRRSRKPGVPADRPARGVFQVFTDGWRLLSFTRCGDTRNCVGRLHCLHFLECAPHLSPSLERLSLLCSPGRE